MKRIGITAVLLTVVLTANVFAITPYNEKKSDFDATIVTKLTTTNNNSFLFQYTVSYSLSSPRALKKLSITYKTNELKDDYFSYICGKANNNNNWVGLYSDGTIYSSIFFIAWGGEDKSKNVSDQMMLWYDPNHLQPGRNAYIKN